MIINIFNYQNLYIKLEIDEISKTTKVLTDYNRKDVFLNAVFSENFSYERVLDFITSRTSAKSGTLREKLSNESRSFNDSVSIIIEE